MRSGKSESVHRERGAVNLRPKLLKTDGTVQEVAPRNGKAFKLREMQRMVGGDIEICYPPSKAGAIMVINTDGKILGLPLNRLATEMWQEFCQAGSARSGDPIVGDVLLCHDCQVE